MGPQAIRVGILLAAMAAVTLVGCGGNGAGSDAGNTEDMAAGVTTITVLGVGAAGQGGGSLNVTTAKGTTGLKTIYDDASSACLFETPAATGGGIQIVTGTAPSNTSCTSKNKCILCTLGSATPVTNCTISCVGSVPSTAATTADSVWIFITFTSTLHTDAATAVGMVRYDVFSTGWTEFSMSNFPVATSFTGCDGTAGNYEMGLDTNAVVYDYPYWTATHQVNGYAVNALNPDSGTTPANQSTCTSSFKYFASMPLTGADVPNTTIDFSGKTISFKATMCDVADAASSDPSISTNCPAQ